jgi:hypothetical protein
LALAFERLVQTLTQNNKDECKNQRDLLVIGSPDLVTRAEVEAEELSSSWPPPTPKPPFDFQQAKLNDVVPAWN